MENDKKKENIEVYNPDYKPKPQKVRPTLKQQRAAALLIKYNGVACKAMKEAGYSPSACRAPGLNLYSRKGFEIASKGLVEQLEEERQAVIEDMKKKRKKAGYQHLTSSLDTTTKLIQLLGGNATEIIQISDEEKGNIDKLFNKN